jgi:uncharacterized hydrophobic protein (TIGR00271 family)
MNDLAVTKVEHWAYRFTVMITLSVVVAVMGLALNSAAVVIGAMLLAPLMQPVLAAGACISMALFTKSLIAMAKVAAATVWCIAISYVLSLLLPEAPLTSEVLARTQPDIKDLVVALAAGAAGAYATVRADASSSLPGVAVAVALVPPLGSVGVALEHGETALAVGALLLYMTNLSAIIFASIAVFIFTGFVPPRRLSDNLLRLTMATVALVALVIVIAVPLYRASIESIDRNEEQQLAEQIVTDWLGDLDDRMDRTVTIRRDEQQVVVDLRGFEDPPDQANLVTELQAQFPGYDIAVQVVRLQQATTTTIPPPEPTEQLLAEIRVEVEAWLDASGIDYQLDDVKLDGRLVRIDAAGTGEPPVVDGLVPRLEALDETLTPGLNWVKLETITATTVPSATELTAQEMRTYVEQWAAERDVLLRGFDYDGARVEVEVAGAVEPDLPRLQIELRRIGGSDVVVELYFIQRQLVTTTVIPELPIPDAGLAPEPTEDP